MTNIERIKEMGIEQMTDFILGIGKIIPDCDRKEVKK
jgi:hypothetical protein